MTNSVKVALYVRVSTQEQAKEGYSIGEQTDRLTKYAQAHDWVIYNTYVDAGFSGANMERPGLKQMLADVKKGGINKVVVYKLDRLSRSQKDTLSIIEDQLLQNNCDFESMTEKFDTSTAFGKAMVGILAVFAQLEREQIKERLTMGMEARIKEGKFRGGIVPFGYDYDSSLDKLVINEYEAMIVKLIYDKYISGTTTWSITKELHDKGYVFLNHKATNKGITYILSNKTYAGYLKLRNEWIKALHDPIISEETFEQAQLVTQQRSERFKATGHVSNGGKILTNFTGFIYCGKCGARYGKINSGRKQPNGKYKFETYVCYSRNKRASNMARSSNCMNKSYRMNEFDEIIFNEINKLVLDPNYLKAIKSNHNKKEEVVHIKAIEKQIKQLDNQISRFMDLYGIGKFSIEQLDEKTTPLIDQKDKLHQELERLKNESHSLSDSQIHTMVKSLNEAIEHGTVQQRREIIEQLIDKIIIDEDDITIHWNFN